MGLLVDGVWQDDVSRTKDGHFIRPAAQFRNWVTPDGSAGPSGDGGFPAESGRYHLYVSLACPWAHRTIIFRKLKALDSVVSLSTVSPNVGRDGWTFNKAEGSTGDDIYGKSKLSEIYLIANPRYSGRVSVPVLWDKKRKTIVNNESPEIIRMLNSAFNAFTNVHTDYYPENLHAEINRFNDIIYPNINNGVYRSGFARQRLRAGVPHGRNCLWRHKGSGKPCVKNETTGPELPNSRLFERRPTSQLSRAHSQSKPEDA
jgi:putative glutathione S-transferase